jgi:threonine synthase
LRRLRPGSLWRWREGLSLPPGTRILTAGEGDVPLETVPVGSLSVLLLREDLNPSGSCKDRGAATLVASLAALDCERLVADSAGNGALALARYARRAGLGLRALLPAELAEAKRDALLATGAELRLLRGSPTRRRQEALSEVAAGRGHAAILAEHPFALGGAKTLAFHLYERMGETLPDLVALPAGQGTLLRALDLGFRDLEHHGLTDRRPALVGVRCPEREVPELEAPDPSLLELAAKVALESGGGLTEVSAVELDAAWRRQWWEGRFLELAAAAPLAWIARQERRGRGRSLCLAAVATGAGIRGGRPVAGEPSPR